MYVQGQFDTEDYPPAYDIHTQDTHPPASASASIPAAVGDPLTKLNQKPTNFLYVDETHHSIKGTYVIDPSLHIPEAYLHPLNPEEERKNLYLHSRDGSVDVDLWIVGRKSDSYQEKQRHDPRPTKIHVSSRSGTVSVKVVRVPLSPVQINTYVVASRTQLTISILCPSKFSRETAAYLCSSHVRSMDISCSNPYMETVYCRTSCLGIVHSWAR